jgi:hypothetical protein
LLGFSTGEHYIWIHCARGPEICVEVEERRADKGGGRETMRERGRKEREKEERGRREEKEESGRKREREGKHHGTRDGERNARAHTHTHKNRHHYGDDVTDECSGQDGADKGAPIFGSPLASTTCTVTTDDIIATSCQTPRT